MTKKEIAPGLRFGRLTVIDEAEPSVSNGGKRKFVTRYANVVCDCGTVKRVNWYTLTRGTTTSCGCALSDELSKRNKRPKSHSDNLEFGSRWTIDGDVATLTVGGKVLVVDADSAPIVSQYRWSLAGGKYGIGYNQKTGERCRIHRLLMRPPKNKQIDHIDRDTLNNRRSNLRICTQAENLRNKDVYRKAKSGYRGVVEYKTSWEARIGHKGKIYILGYFPTAIEAAIARDKAAKELHGEFAVLNF